MFRGRTHWYW